MGERILVADDNRASAEILCRYLANQGSATVVCENGEECLAEVDQGDVSMIFLEVAMPDISGLEVLSSIRRKYDPLELPVIFVTERHDADLLATALDLGANDLLHKPVNCRAAIPRIYQQITAFKLHQQRWQSKRNAILSAMLATYNHDLGNTLADAIAEVQIARMHHDSVSLIRVANALKRIGRVAGRIEEFGAADVEESGYLLGGKLLRLRKEFKF